ncbi:MAG TPA: DNA alkylation repair protein, partial [Chthonomonadaceae bacterium]|nr:DNA alkylation repair protein [Chthonomonadaceae bacterium]
MTAAEILAEIEPLGSESYRKVIRNHGVKDPMFGVKVEDLKKIQKRIKKDYRLALELYETGNYDACYLAGLIADDAAMTKADLQRWAEQANCYPLCESTVAWVAAESRFGREMALQWIESDRETIASCGWATLSGVVAVAADADLDISELRRLLQRVEAAIHSAPNRVRSTMNGFVISVGSYVAPLADVAMQAAERIGKVTVDVGNTACKVAFAPDYILKARQRGSLTKKRKTVKC